MAGAPAAMAEPRTDVTPPVVTADQVMPHLDALQRIADRDGGNRAHGTQGYRDSVAYVKAALDKAGFRTALHRFTYNGTTDYNLIADWPGGDPEHIVFAGAHLDSVAAGPGINDNGSGSAALLTTALEVSKAHLKPHRHLRFAWWGAEEAGTVGSSAYVRDLSAAERHRIDVYLNVDMAGTKNNQEWLIVDDDPEAFEAFEGYFAARKLPTAKVGTLGSDHESFNDASIPVGGFAKGLDDCYHAACDRVENVDPQTETTSTNAFISTVWQLAARR
ncbi:M20/M25/M40 family metallo-hydrolase [Streptomyces sp. PSAA01]|uniref:M20/M25/M40 family metallo-hydrolase n=1 Tax=Streptomyces sp. PSAA01 TaxID=2912762 RepID=UPI001F3F272F|nr:M20/M25/M40 family metallo-hydrolase [Streptomyces sp. PSAA01]MCG0284582.1 M20/M25/M40 family metallo-hydrolase [Streptomyces sp. PSAA01]